MYLSLYMILWILYMLRNTYVDIQKKNVFFVRDAKGLTKYFSDDWNLKYIFFAEKYSIDFQPSLSLSQRSQFSNEVTNLLSFLACLFLVSAKYKRLKNSLF